MSDTARHRFRSWGALASIVLLATAVPVAVNLSANAAGNFTCSSGYQIDKTLTNGARWQMCWERREAEGIVLHDVVYTPIDGQSVEVLGRASLAEIHVPYDLGRPRFHDLSDYGLGFLSGGPTEPGMQNLTAGDCPGGSLLPDGGSNVLCQTEAPAGYAYKDYAEQAQTTSLNLFSTSCIGAYCYVVAWNFDDDGTIRPEVGATGTLQYIDTGPSSGGWPIGDGRRAVAHMHNYYWRLDFDVNGPADDRVEELEAIATNGRSRLNNTRRQFSSEVARRVAPGGFRSWRVLDTVMDNADGHPISWELQPNTDHIFRGPTYEPYSQNQLYVTRNKVCERFATNNIPTGTCQNSPNDSVAAFANGEGVSGRDVVVWYSSSFHHLPRDEDEDHMHPHWSGFSIVPRDLTATNPAG